MICRVVHLLELVGAQEAEALLHAAGVVEAVVAAWRRTINGSRNSDGRQRGNIDAPCADDRGRRLLCPHGASGADRDVRSDVRQPW